MNLMEICERIQQRPPFQMVERITEIRPLEYAKGIKAISVNDPYFIGHFPGMPIMPGVLITEAAAQLCSVVLSYRDDIAAKVPVLLKIDQMKFITAVIPGDVLTIEVTSTVNTSSIAKFSVAISVQETKVASGELSFAYMEKAAIYQRK
jgi:3-hydroxyacyl-[acyl-carrier-protein] dehydratase